MKMSREKMKRKLALLVLTILTTLIISAFPAKAWVYPNGSEDTRFELYDPHVQGILIRSCANG